MYYTACDEDTSLIYIERGISGDKISGSLHRWCNVPIKNEQSYITMILQTIDLFGLEDIIVIGWSESH